MSARIAGDLVSTTSDEPWSVLHNVGSAYKLHGTVPRGRDKGVLLYVGPIDRKYFPAMLLPGANGKIL